jgi:hypothetical protein
MKQRLGILLVLVLLVVVLVGLNAATYVQREKTPDSEVMPNRSTFNSGATGTQGFYSLLAETGRKVTRWQSPIDALLTEKRNPPATFVVIGRVRKPFDELETKQLLNWVNDGGRLVMIDREPPEEILDAIKDWEIEVKSGEVGETLGVDPADQKQMTTGASAAKPVQPTAFTKSVNAVQTSRFVSDIEFKWKSESLGQGSGLGDGKTSLQANDAVDFFGSPTPVPPPPPKAPEKFTVKEKPPEADEIDTASYSAPVLHLASGERGVLVDVPYGIGSIAILSDPYVVSNTGIQLVDNAQLAVNVVTAGGGLVAFDEYHQGYGSNQNRFFQYFAGTPVIAIFVQLAVIAAFIFFSQSRRFARPVPEPEPDRLSKLEYVSAMAELQQRTRAFDLAIENIYSDFRRRVSRLFGVDNKTTTRRQLSQLIAERVKADPNVIEELLYTCEGVIHGEPTNKREAVELATSLRELESALGLQRAGRSRIG